MPTITDWLMVIITVIYVIATICICVFNGRSAKATREQVAEMKREHREDVRLTVLPYFDINFAPFNRKIHRSTGIVHLLSKDPGIKFAPGDKMVIQNMNLKNIGKYIATSIQIDIEYGDIEIHHPIKDLTINPGVEEFLDFSFKVPYADVYGIDVSPSSTPFKNTILTIKFNDILGNRYAQTAHISFAINPILPTKAEDGIDTKGIEAVTCNVSIVSYSVEPPVLISEKEV